MSYTQRKNKHYKHPKPNAIRTPQTRRAMYCFLRQSGLTRTQTRIVVNWRIPKQIQWLKQNGETQKCQH